MAYEKYGIAFSLLPSKQDQLVGTFEVITIWSLIEYVLDPVAVLRSAFDALLEGELVFFLYTCLVHV